MRGKSMQKDLLQKMKEYINLREKKQQNFSDRNTAEIQFRRGNKHGKQGSLKELM